MKPVRIETRSKKMLADVFTPVGIYMRLRDRFRDTLLLESTDTQSAENSWSFICVNAIAGVEVLDAQNLEYKLPGQKPEKVEIKETPLTDLLKAFMQRFEMLPIADKEAKFAQGLYGYTAYDAIRFFENIPIAESEPQAIGLLRYRLYQYVIAIHHHQDALYLCENVIDGMESEIALLESIIRSKDVPVFPFALQGDERSSLSDVE
ncbi:MAG: anthranilate synthase component I family protein, partial [Bacteroidetes bacterium]|nr:anthranilate synthase component I family protein [Bacteroidota bacterium]